jgi:DNA-binding transcriptional ArsR family regulator
MAEEMGEEHHHVFFKMFSNKLRLSLMFALMLGPLSVSELAERVGFERSRVSHALLQLERCNIVKASKVGRTRLYRLHADTVTALLKVADEHAAKYCRRCWLTSSQKPKS